MFDRLVDEEALPGAGDHGCAGYEWPDSYPDVRPGDDWPGDDWPGDEWPGDEWPGDEWPGDEWPGDEWPGEGWTGEGPPEPSLAELPASGFAALELDWATAQPGEMSDTELVDATVGLDRVVCWAQARQARLLAEFARRRGDTIEAFHDRRPSVGSRYAPDEVGVALRISRGAAMARLAQARGLDEVLPAVLAAWEDGRLDAGKVRAISDATGFLPAAHAAAVAARVLARAPELSVAELRAALAKAVLAVDPDGAAERHRAARRDRRVSVNPQPEGMASLWALLSAPDARSAWESLTRLARGLGGEDPRGMDARRADLLAALLTGRLTALDTSPDTSPDTTDGDATTDDSHSTDDTTDDSHSTDDTPSSDVDPADPAGCDTAAAAAAVRDDTATDHSTADDPAADSPAAEGPADAISGARPTGARPTGDRPGAAAGSAGGPHVDPAAAGPPGGEDPARPARERLRPVTPGKPLIHVIVPYSTLVGADDQPCELAGYGPIPADLAREIAADAVWQRLVTDPLSGALLDHGRTTYHPPAALADFVRARDLYCRGPRCRRPATTSELDHFIPYPQGPTSEPNLSAYCKHDHDLKHHGGWQVLLHPDRSLEWITPSGYRYTSSPHDYRPDPADADPGLPGPEPGGPRRPHPDPRDDEPPPF